MCQKCLDRYETLPPDLIRLLSETENDLLKIVDKLQPAVDAYIPLTEAFHAVEELDPKHPDYAEAMHQLNQLKRNTTLAYLVGWHAAARAKSSVLANMYLQGAPTFIATGSQDRLAQTHHLMQVKN